MRRRDYVDAYVFTGQELDLGLQEYRKPLCHLHTQFNREIPYDAIDMDFMNENQSAHGGREYGHIVSRMGLERKVIVGYWADPEVQAALASWMRTAVGVIGIFPYPRDAAWPII